MAWGFPLWLSWQRICLLCRAPGLGRSPGEGKGYPLQYSGLENSKDYTVHGAAKSRTRLSDSLSFSFLEVKKKKSQGFLSLTCGSFVIVFPEKFSRILVLSFLRDELSQRFHQKLLQDSRTDVYLTASVTLPQALAATRSQLRPGDKATLNLIFAARLVPTV